MVTPQGLMLAGVGCMLTAASVSAQIPVPRVIALTGRPVPGVEASAYTALNRPVVGSGGVGFFTGEYNAPGGFKRMVMTSAPLVTGASIFRREGDPVGELGGLPVVWGSTFGLLGAERRFCVFTGVYGGGGSGGTGVWQGVTSGLALRTTATAGVNAPGTTAPFAAFHALAVADGGGFALRASTTATSANTGIWVGIAAGVAPYIIEGDLPPDVPAGVEYDDVGVALHDPVINSEGSLAVLVPLRGAGVTSTNNRALLIGPPQGERIVARTGSPAPQMPAGAVFATLAAPWINGSNDVVFSGRVTGGGVGPNDDEGLWIVRWPSVTPELIAREGIAAPNIGGGILLHERTSGLASFRQTIINNRGTVFFISGLLGVGINNDNDAVIYRADRVEGGGWNLALVAREGQDAPGLAAGVDKYGPFGQLWSNATGRLAFTTQIAATSFWALFAGTPGGFRVVAAANRTLDVGPPGSPDLRTVRPFYNQFGPISSSGGGDGLAGCLSDLSTLVYRAEFTDGSFGILEVSVTRADLNGDGMISVQDIFDLLSAWFALSATADYNGDGLLSVQDIFDYLKAWFEQQ